MTVLRNHRKLYNEVFSFSRRKTVSTESYTCEECDIFKNIANANVLLIGGGPSVLGFKPVKKYDFILSCNSFFRNKELRSFCIDLAFVGSKEFIRDINKNDFQSYIATRNTIFAFDYFPPVLVSNIKNLYKKHFQKIYLTIPSYYSEIGTMARLIYLIHCLKPKTVDFIGIDGAPKNASQRLEHGFEGRKFTNSTTDRNKYITRYTELWNVLQKIQKETIYTNLGYGHPYNTITVVQDRNPEFYIKQ